MIEELSGLYKRIRQEFKPLQDLVGVPFMVGGGCVGDLISFGKVLKDYDIFFKTREDMSEFESKIKRLGFRLQSETNMGRQYVFLGTNFDLVTWEVKPHPSKWHMEFDFTVNSAVVDGDELWMHKRTIYDCTNKLLVPVRTLELQYGYRIKRYINKGYRVPPNSPLENILFDRPIGDCKIPEHPESDIICVDLSQF